ncbi:MAG: DUF1707 domain-containing protein [Nocardioides sp.]|uniref:DUF1707 SHOCT-like domain-containing protein n=1 Tax=Nocardioides sp. TaxID=35761 RepID=UPI0039E34134
MIDPQKKAKNADRDAAIEVVEAAYADGQITQPDYELRVDRLLRAVTVGEVQMLVADLRRDPEEKVTDVVEAVTGETTTPPPPPPYGKASSARKSSPNPAAAARPRSRLWAVIGGLVVLVFVVVTVALPVLRATRGRDGVAKGPMGLGPQVSLLTPEGYDIFLDALEEKTGSREAFSLVVYPGYAVVDVPVDRTSQRKHSWYFDGDWSDFGGSGTSHDERFAADQIDGTILADGVRRAKAGVEDPTTWYAVLRAPDPNGDNECLVAIATNEFSESKFVSLRCDGSVIKRP